MKSNKILLALLVVLTAVAIFIFTNNDNATMDEIEGAKSEFAVEDTSGITKIFIADAKGQKVTLERKNDRWMVDGKYNARPDNVRLLMKTFGRIKVRMPVPKSARNGVITSLATEAIKVEIYQGEAQPAKTYYVGGPTSDHQGTYMLLETEGVKSTVPFITHIPGFYGYLTARFFAEPQQWRDAVVFKYTAKEIQSIEVNYYEDPSNSFLIEKENEKFNLKDIASKQVVANVDTTKLKRYISLYEGIYYEMIDLESSKEKIDSTIASQPFFTIEVKTMLGGGDKIVVYHMPNYRKTLDPNEEPYEYDVDRMYAYLNEDLFVYIQFATFDKITLPKSFFTKQ